MNIVLQEMLIEGDINPKLCRENLYAGCVMKHNHKKGKSKFCRKILFTLDKDGNVEDVLYDSPSYKTKLESTDQKFYVSYITKLNQILEHYDYNYQLEDKDIRELYSYFIAKNALFFKDNHTNLPMSLDEYAYLEIIAKQRKKPTRTEKKEFEKFKAKTKTYTFR